MVVKTYGNMDQRLQEQAARPAFRRPGRFPYFMALEIFAPIEQFDSTGKQGVHRRIGRQKQSSSVWRG
jgi:hypothetical protein